jgi:hypothetical protein
MQAGLVSWLRACYALRAGQWGHPAVLREFCPKNTFRNQIDVHGVARIDSRGFLAHSTDAVTDVMFANVPKRPARLEARRGYPNRYPICRLRRITIGDDYCSVQFTRSSQQLCRSHLSKRRRRHQHSRGHRPRGVAVVGAYVFH